LRPVPAIEKHGIEPDGKLSQEATLIGPEGVDLIRQIEVDVVLSLDAAIVVRDTLQNFIKILEANKGRPQPPPL